MASFAVQPNGSTTGVNNNVRKFRPTTDVQFRESEFDSSRNRINKQRSRERQALRSLKHQLRAA